MKKLISILVMIILVSPILQAQDDDFEFFKKNPTGVQIGALVGIRAGINTATYEGFKNRPVVSGMPDISVMGSYILNRNDNTKLSMEIGYHTYAYGNLRSPDNGTKYYSDISCIVIVPQVTLNILNLGLAIGIPSSASGSISNGSNSIDSDVPTDAMGTFIEGRVGIDAKVLSDKTGDLIFYAKAGYLFNSPLGASDQDHIVSLTLGLGYMFNIPQ